MGRRELGMAGGLLLLALVVRLVYLEHSQDNPFFSAPVVDAHSYVAQARQIVEVSWVGDKPFWQPPLYPYFLALIYAVSGDLFWTPRFIQFLLGAASCALVFGIGRQVFGTRVGLLAGAMACLYGPSIYFEGELLPTALAVFLNLLLLLVLLQPDRGRGQALVSGLVQGLAIVAVPNAALLAPCACLWYWKSTERAVRSKLVWCLLFAATASAVVGAVTARNWVVSGEFIPLSWNGGVNFYLGNHPDYDRLVGIRPGPEWEGLMEQPMAAGYEGYAERSAYFYRQAGDWIASAPGDFVRLLGVQGVFVGAGRGDQAQPRRVLRPHLFLADERLAVENPPLCLSFWAAGALGCCGYGLGLAAPTPGEFAAALHRRVQRLAPASFLLPAAIACPWCRCCCSLLDTPCSGWCNRDRPDSGVPWGSVWLWSSCWGSPPTLACGRPIPWPTRKYTLIWDASKPNEGQYAAAVHSFGTAVQLDPNYLRARHNLGAALAVMKRYDEAETVYRQGLAQAPEDRGLHLNLAALYRATGRYEQAVEHYRRVLATKADAAVFLALGRVYKKMGATEQARGSLCGGATWRRSAGAGGQ